MGIGGTNMGEIERNSSKLKEVVLIQAVLKMQWLELYVQPRQSCTNLVDLTRSETTETIDENSSENESLQTWAVSPATLSGSELT